MMKSKWSWSLIIAVIFVLTAVFLVSAGEGLETVEKARYAFHAGEYQEAEELWQQVLELENYRWEANFFLGMTYLRLNDYQAGVEYMSEAYQLRPEDYSTLVNYARLLYRNQQREEAREVLQEVPEDMREQDEQYYNLRGLLAMAEDDLERATASLEIAVEINPDNYHVRNNLGLANIRKGNFADAVDHLEEAVAQEPAEAYIYNNLGVAYENLTELEPARENYERALELDPDYERAELNLERVTARLEN